MVDLGSQQDEARGARRAEDDRRVEGDGDLLGVRIALSKDDPPAACDDRHDPDDGDRVENGGGAKAADAADQVRHLAEGVEECGSAEDQAHLAVDVGRRLSGAAQAGRERGHARDEQGSRVPTGQVGDLVRLAHQCGKREQRRTGDKGGEEQPPAPPNVRRSKPAGEREGRGGGHRAEAIRGLLCGPWPIGPIRSYRRAEPDGSGDDAARTTGTGTGRSGDPGGVGPAVQHAVPLAAESLVVGLAATGCR